MGRTFSTQHIREIKNLHNILVETRTEGDHLREAGISGKITLK
jgi:hypothetical protein